jgi:hypothetical protein
MATGAIAAALAGGWLAAASWSPARGSSVGAGEGRLALPPGPVAELVARIGPEVEPAAVGPGWPAWSDRSAAGWGGEPAWRRWIELLALESAGPAPDPRRRAELALLARAQGRDGDAWAHLVAAEASPAIVAGLLPFFSPGVPLEHLGRAVLPEGVVLAPALPPSADGRGGLRQLAGTEIECREFAVGAARCSLRVSVQRDGLEVRLLHLGGGPARVAVAPPLPRGIERGLVLADWEKLTGSAAAEPVEFLLAAEPPEHSLWLTFHPRAERWPDPRAEVLAAVRVERELVVCSPAGDEAHLARFAAAAGELLGIPARLAPQGFAAASGREPLVLNLGRGPGDEAKLVEILGALEAFLLRPAVR